MRRLLPLLFGVLTTLILLILVQARVLSLQNVQQSLEKGPSLRTNDTLVTEALRSSPVMFIENVGQFDERARFQVRGAIGTMWLTEDAIWITVVGPLPSPPPSATAPPLPSPSGV